MSMSVFPKSVYCQFCLNVSGFSLPLKVPTQSENIEEKVERESKEASQVIKKPIEKDSTDKKNKVGDGKEKNIKNKSKTNKDV